MRKADIAVILLLFADPALAVAPTPSATLKCSGVEERQVRDVVPTEKGALKMGAFGAPTRIPETFEQIFKAAPFRIVNKDRGGVTSTQDCDVKGTTFVCVITQPGSKASTQITFNLDTGAYSSASESTLVKSTRAGTCDMAEAKSLLAAGKP